jgi:hypothetical protein
MIDPGALGHPCLLLAFARKHTIASNIAWAR